MDAFEDGNEGNVSTNGFNKLMLIAYGLGLIGIVIGLAGLFVGLGAGKDLDAYITSLESAPDELGALSTRLNELEEGLVKLGSETVKLSRQDRQLQENTKNAFDAVQDSIVENRSAINAISERLNELPNLAKSASLNPGAPASVGSADAEPETEVDRLNSVPDGNVHIVQSGDTLSKIAKQYGMTLSDIQAANPTVNPRALQIGQKINLK
jgi:DNA repair ATPase RecN